MITPRLTYLIPIVSVAALAVGALPALAHTSDRCAPVVKSAVHKVVHKTPARTVRVKTVRVVHRSSVYRTDYRPAPCDCDHPVEVRYITPPPPEPVLARVHVFRGPPRPWDEPRPVVVEQPVRVVYVEHAHHDHRYVHHWQRWPDWIGNGR